MNDDEKFAAYGAELVAAVDASLRPWLFDAVARRGVDVDELLISAIDEVARLASQSLRELAAADVDAPLSGPLERIRQAVVTLTPTLDAAGAQRPERDPFDVQLRPDDVYAIGPMAFGDLGDDVHMAGITWGAAKAHLHNQRRRS